MLSKHEKLHYKMAVAAAAGKGHVRIKNEEGLIEVLFLCKCCGGAGMVAGKVCLACAGQGLIKDDSKVEMEHYR
jgi:DnaJ-class molecular chaperone